MKFKEVVQSINLVKDFFSLLEEFNTQPNAYRHILHPRVEQVEYPNSINKTTTCRGFDALIRGLESGRALLCWQRFDVQRHYSIENGVIAELHWTAELNINLGSFKKGQVIKAYSCMIMELKDGLIYRQRNYKCYEHW